MLVMQVAEQTDSESFKYNIYSTVVTAFTYVFPILILPLALPIATLRTCISRQCCVPRYKQPIGELIMTSILCLIYLGTLVGVVLPTLAPMLKQAGVEVSVILKIEIFDIAGRTCKFEYLYITQGHRGGGSKNGNFPLIHVMKVSLCRGVGGSKKPQNTLT